MGGVGWQLGKREAGWVGGMKGQWGCEMKREHRVGCGYGGAGALGCQGKGDRVQRIVMG